MMIIMELIIVVSLFYRYNIFNLIFEYRMVFLNDIRSFIAITYDKLINKVSSLRFLIMLKEKYSIIIKKQYTQDLKKTPLSNGIKGRIRGVYDLNLIFEIYFQTIFSGLLYKFTDNQPRYTQVYVGLIPKTIIVTTFTRWEINHGYQKMP